MVKRGRPVLEDPRVNEYRVRMNSIEFERLDRVCKDLGMNKADTMRKLIEDYENEHMKQSPFGSRFAKGTFSVIGE